VAAVVCAVPPTDVAAFAGKCEPIASTLRIGNASPFPVGADDVYATAVNDALGPLQTAVFDHGKQLGESQTPADRSQAAKLLAQDYGRAAKQLGSLPVSPADQATNASIVNALEQARLGYEDVAAAATGGDEQAYQKALAAAAQDEAALDGPLAALQATGYRSSGGPGGSGSSEGAEDGGGAGDSRSDDPSDDAPEHGEA
jgi:hypothetical protein